MYSVYGKRPSVKGERGFPFTQTDQEYHTLQEVLERLVRENGRIPPPIQDPSPEDSLDDIDPTKQRGFDLADAAMISAELNEKFAEAKKKAKAKENVAPADIAVSGDEEAGDGPKLEQK